MRRTISWMAGVFLVLALSAAAWSQGDPLAGPDEELTEPEPEPEPTEPEPEPTRTTSAANGGSAMGSSAARRPSAWSIGLGFGWTSPFSFDAPNTTSARFLLSNKLMFEPRLELSRSGFTSAVGNNDSTDSFLAFVFGVDARWVLKQRSNIELVVIGGLVFDYLGSNPEGDDNNITTTSFGGLWGVGLDYWIRPHWQLSFSARNPFFGFTSQTQEAAPDDIKDSSSFFGLVFEPEISLMVHLFF